VREAPPLSLEVRCGAEQGRGRVVVTFALGLDDESARVALILGDMSTIRREVTLLLEFNEVPGPDDDPPNARPVNWAWPRRRRLRNPHGISFTGLPVRFSDLRNTQAERPHNGRLLSPPRNVRARRCRRTEQWKARE